MRRYEILLPLRFNDGTLAAEELVGEAMTALRDQFGAVSFETQTIHGVWRQGSRSYKDDLVRLFADVPDTEENREWFVQFKERLKREFRQLDIWIITHPIEVL